MHTWMHGRTGQKQYPSDHTTFGRGIKMGQLKKQMCVCVHAHVHSRAVKDGIRKIQKWQDVGSKKWETYRKCDSPERKAMVSGRSTAISTTDDSTTDVTFDCIRYKQSALFIGSYNNNNNGNKTTIIITGHQHIQAPRPPY